MATATPNAFAATLLEQPERVFAWHAGRAIDAATFLSHARTLAARWPADVRVVNVCEQRYHFLVGFAAALLRGGATILPPSRAPALNPAENLRRFMRENWLSNRVFGAYDDIVVAVDDARRKLLAMP